MHAPTSPSCATLPDSSERAQARRAKVTDAARNLFAAKGFHNTGIAQVATASGVKVGQIYRDFPSKEAIVAAIVEADFAAFVDTDSLRLAVDAGDRAAVTAAIERLFDPGPCRQIMPEIMAEASRNPRIAEIIEALDARFCDTLSAALAVFAPGAAMRARRDDVAEAIMVLVIGMCHRSGPGGSRTRAALPAPVRALIAHELDALVVGADAR